LKTGPVESNFLGICDDGEMRKAACALVLVTAICSGAAQAGAATAAQAGAATAPAASASSAAGSWPLYHGDLAGSGAAAGVTAVDTSHRAWTSPALDGEIYGEPLVWSGRIYVATENDTVYALSARTGTVAWSAHLGSPVPATALPCGDITPTVGITGTPVIDESRDEIFVVADEDSGGTPAHILVGLDATSGQREMTRDVDPAGAQTAALLQRTGLTLDAGQVVFGFGGNDGDCASYRGRVVAVSETGGTPRDFTVDVTAGESQGAIWMGGAAPVVDGRGDVLVSVGNGSVYSAAHAFDDSDSVLELSPSLRLLQFFAPGNWAANNSRDLDMSTAPVLLSDGQVLLTGKSRIVYLLNGATLGGIGGQQASLGAACDEDIDGGSAVTGMTAYLPCYGGIIAVRATEAPAALNLLWSSGTGGGPAIVAAGLVWTIGQNGTLYGLDPATGRVRQQASIGVPANHFPTPSVGDGLLLVPSARDVVAFAAASSAASSSPQPVTSPSATPASSSSPRPSNQASAAASGTLNEDAIAAIVVAALVVIGGISWLLRRRLGSGAGPRDS
jgi:outer membrane protein assembly factor BamB